MCSIGISMLTCLIWFLVFKISTSYNIQSEVSVTENSLTKLIEKHFTLQTTLVVTTDNDDKIVLPPNNKPYIIINHSKLPEILPNIELKPNYFLISYSNVNDLNTSIELIKASYCFDSRVKYLVIANDFEDLDSIAQILWSYRLYKSAILFENELFQIDFENIKCGRDVKSIKKKSQLFQPKIEKSFRNCSLRIIFSSLEPWIYEVDDNNGTNPIGIFQNILEMFTTRHSFHADYLPENPQYGYELKESYSFESVRNDFDRDYADIYLGVGNNLPSGMESTFPVCDDNLYWAIPKPQSLPISKAMFKFLSVAEWLFLIAFCGVFCMIFSIIAYVTKTERFKDYVLNAFNIYAIFIGSSNANLKHLNRPLKLLITTCSFVSLLIVVIVQAKLYSVMRNPMYENDITDQDKLLDSGLSMKFNTGISVIFLFMGSQNQRVFDDYIPFNVDLSEAFQQLMSTMDFATIVDRGFLIRYPDIKKKLNIVPLFYFQVSMLMQHYHHLFESFNNSVIRFFEGGLIDKVISDTSFSYSLKNQMPNDPEYLQFDINHLLGAFLLSLYGCGIGVLVFLFEIVLSRLITLWTRKHAA